MPASNAYHLLSFIPAVESWQMPAALEAMAQRLVQSGRLRINADVERNFVQYSTATSDETFSRRELTDPALRAQTWRRVARHVAPAAGEDGISQAIDLLHGELKKTRPVSLEKELRVARVLVQSAHPAVIELLLMAGTEIFVSYLHNVSDLMPVYQWQSHGVNNGMQATSDRGTAVYVSCGGDPFCEGEQKTYVTDGFPALARMVVIAGQEFGHFSDLLRRDSQIVGRYSLDPRHMQMRAAPRVAQARLADIARVTTLQTQYQAAGLARLRRVEATVAFYSKRWKFSPPWLLHQCSRIIAFMIFIQRCKASGMHLNLRVYPRMMHGHALGAFLEDMAFNLAPEADAYRRADPLEEEAIACVEALARVPQQVHKWGHPAVKFAWPQLYALYYDTVIVGCIAAAAWDHRRMTRTRAEQLRYNLHRLFRLFRTFA